MLIPAAAMPGTRNATLADMVTILRSQRARRLDVVAPAGAIHAHDGNLVIDSTVSQLGADGVTSAAGTYRPTAVADEGIADKLGISLAYLRRLRAQPPGSVGRERQRLAARRRARRVPGR